MKKIFLLLTVIFSLMFASCTRTLGYGIVLWGNDEAPVTDGEIVKVYIRSNISKVYVVSKLDSKEKFEIPLWQLTDPESKGKAMKRAERYKEYEHKYATCAFDGLPIRAEALNTSKQVYRLREGEVIRTLYEGKGAAPTNGRGNLEGKWLRVLTAEGTQGWCFSYNLRLFEKEPGQSLSATNDVVVSEKVEGLGDAKLQAALSKMWYPENYNDMIRRGQIDLSAMNENYGLRNHADGETKFITITLPNVYFKYNYESVEKNLEGAYEFFATSGAAVSGLKITLRSGDLLIAQYTEKNGKQKAENFIILEKPYEEIVEAETARRRNEYEQIFMAGPVFSSSNYGTLTLEEDGTFSWTGYDLLSPSIIGRGARGRGTVNIKMFLDKSLKVSYDGVLSFNFAGLNKSVNFLYKITDGGLRLEDTTTSTVKDAVIKSRSASPVVVFFSSN